MDDAQQTIYQPGIKEVSASSEMSLEFYLERRTLCNDVAPSPRWAVMTAVTGGRVYVFGGHSRGKHEYLNDFWSFSLDEQMWEEIGTPADVRPNPRLHGTLHVSDDQKIIYLVGGCTRSDGGGKTTFSDTNDLWKFDIESRKWTNIPIPKDNVHMGHMSLIYMNKLIMFGRTGLSCLDSFDPATGIWTKIQAGGKPPTQLIHSAWAMRGNKIYIHGGIGSGNISIADFFVLDLKTNMWTKLQPFGPQPPPRHGHCCCISGSYLFVSPGLCRSTQTTKFTEDFHVFDLECNQWLQMKCLGGNLPKIACVMVPAAGNSINLLDMEYSSSFKEDILNIFGFRSTSTAFYRLRYQQVKYGQVLVPSVAGCDMPGVYQPGLRRRRLQNQEEVPLLQTFQNLNACP